MGTTLGLIPRVNPRTPHDSVPGMFDGLRDLFHSEKALAGGALIIAATVLVLTGHMTVADWAAYTQVVFLGYVGGKTVQGAVASLTKRSAAIAAPAAPSVPAAADAPSEAEVKDAA